MRGRAYDGEGVADASPAHRRDQRSPSHVMEAPAVDRLLGDFDGCSVVELVQLLEREPAEAQVDDDDELTRRRQVPVVLAPSARATVAPGSVS